MSSTSNDLYFHRLGKKLFWLGVAGIVAGTALLGLHLSPAELDALPPYAFEGAAFAYFCSIPCTCMGAAMWLKPGEAMDTSTSLGAKSGGFEAKWTETPIGTRVVWLGGLVTGAALMLLVEMWLLSTFGAATPAG